MRRTLNFVVMAVMAQFLILRIAKLLAGGFSWGDVVWVHVYLLGIAIALVWELHGRHLTPRSDSAVPVVQPTAPSGPPLRSLVALLRQGGAMNADDVRRRLARAFEASVGETPTDANSLRPGADVAFVLRLAGQRYAIVNEPRAYVKDREAEATAAASRELAIAIVQHGAWRSVDWLDGPSADRDAIYATLGRVLVALTEDVEPLALFCPETGQMVPWTDGASSALRGGGGLKGMGVA